MEISLRTKKENPTKVREIRVGAAISLTDYKFMKYTEALEGVLRARIVTKLGTYRVAVKPSLTGDVNALIVERDERTGEFIESKAAPVYDHELLEIIVSMSIPNLITN